MKYVLPLCLAIVSCGTIAEGDGGSSNLPSRLIIPFNKLAAAEGDEESTLPFVIAEQDVELDEPTAVVNGSGVDIYLQASTDETTVIQRASSPDGISFGSIDTVFEPENAWEGTLVGSPTVIRGNPHVLFYVGGAGDAVGRATSENGSTWARQEQPVFDPDESIESATVVRFDGAYLMYYSVLDEDDDGDLIPVRIELARSSDGLVWAGVGEVFGSASGCTTPSGLDTSCWDGTYVSSPDARVVTSPAGREVVDLWYTAGNGTNSNIGFAGSFDGSTFSRFADNPVVADSTPERAANVVEVDGRLFMYYSDNHSGSRAIGLARQGND